MVRWVCSFAFEREAWCVYEFRAWSGGSAVSRLNARPGVCMSFAYGQVGLQFRVWSGGSAVSRLNLRVRCNLMSIGKSTSIHLLLNIGRFSRPARCELGQRYIRCAKCLHSEVTSEPSSAGISVACVDRVNLNPLLQAFP